MNVRELSSSRTVAPQSSEDFSGRVAEGKLVENQLKGHEVTSTGEATWLLDPKPSMVKVAAALRPRGTNDECVSLTQQPLPAQTGVTTSGGVEAEA